MERHKCKLCSRTFVNGRALGGHMKGHFATLPLPPKPEPVTTHCDDEYASLCSEEDHEEEREEKDMVYGLREKPKKSFRLADPKFSFQSDTVVQDRESETESKNPTRKRSKRNRKCMEPTNKGKLSLVELSPVSSVSETWPEEDVAMCLMMLSRDTWKKKNIMEEQQQKVKPKGLKRVNGKHNKCDKCGKTFRSSRALGSHKSICYSDDDDKSKIFECPFCYKVFGSGQALGGHKRSHLIPSSSSNANNHSTTSPKFKDTFIDLNFPPQPEEDDLSVVSDA
ncbi:hypothetical protein TanjilG_25840 [Lupinus angustifolius]|uniref:C2H2-type domain-containing protein n=1 Tax=Lupinus angustifolius TaxID=3871 RepID=A0A1J7GX08_LUPAN|nr:PREDICTED: zinc finger protein ZAT9-like [Lupinus angustifolius]OIV94616.1 hypothetical protein TanjilG_25840 [Lupinus angustifolius]